MSAHAELTARLITDGYGKTSPSLCSDGKRLAFGWAQSDKRGGEIAMIDITTADSATAPTILAQSPKYDNEPVWSPDCKRIAYMSGRSGDEDIWVYEVETDTYTQMTFSPWGSYWRAQEFGPAWSPDGKRIAFSSDRSSDDDIWWVPAEGGDMVRVTKRTLPFSRDEDRYPSWSPDSKRIVYTSKTAGNWDLWIATVDDTTIAPVQITADSTDEWLPAWSPNGRWIAFVTNRTGSQDIYVMPADGGAAVQLTKNPGADTQPSWSPDGKRIFYSSTRGQEHGIFALEGLEDVLGAEFARSARADATRKPAGASGR